MKRWWTAVERRDPAFDGAFVFAVLTTGIYCRPTCPARRPFEKNVRFFSTPEAAEREGFRSCRRCRPSSGARPTVDLPARACAYLSAHAEERVTLGDLSRRLSVSPHHLQRMFTRALGVSPKEYLSVLRFERFRSRARAPGGVSRALYGAGFGSSSRLYERSRARLGMTPGTYRRGGAGMDIAYDLLDCPLGRALVAATPLGICAVAFGKSDRALSAELSERYPRAAIRREPRLLRRVGGRLRRIFSGAAAGLPLDVRATAFQARVWNELRSIPAGSTRSYGEIARRIGRPGSARAVARACASNPVAVLIPCHRAVGGDGGLSGYRWGTDRKKALLGLERR
jgi:AraC family transcriptional regulator, regulatory protein of adaptative response / methylated-DNA-[protein]-cysteine methyltransferase